MDGFGTVLYLTIAGVLTFFVCKIFKRERCPRCDSENIEQTNVRYGQRQYSKRTVYDRDPYGNIITRVEVSAYQFNEHSYQCQKCKHKWEVTKRQDFTGDF